MKRILVSALLVLLAFSPVAAEKLCTEVGPAGDMLCVVNSENGPNWYVFTGCEDVLTIDAPDTEKQVDILLATVSGRYLAIVSSGDDGAVLGVYSTSKLDFGEAPELEKSIEPAPETSGDLRWVREILLFEVNLPEGADAQQAQYRYDPGEDQLTRLP